jgi:putative hydrolase of the HAD superfamily
VDSPRKKRVRAITFDVFGTLVRLDRPVERLCENIRRKGLEAPQEAVEEAFIQEVRYYSANHLDGRNSRELLSLRSRCAEAFFSALAEQGYPFSLSSDEMVETFMGSIRFQLYEDVPEILDWCASQGLSTGIISDWDCSLVSTLRDLCPGYLFECVLVSACEGITKSDPTIFLRAAACLRVSPSSIVHVGNEIAKDVHTAQQAGFRAVLIDRNSKTQSMGVDSLLKIRELLVFSWS